jgi:hypothetical protein
MYINIYVYQTVHNMYSKFSDILPVQRIEVTQSTTYVNTSPTNWSHPKHNICEYQSNELKSPKAQHMWMWKQNIRESCVYERDDYVCTNLMMCVRTWWCVCDTTYLQTHTLRRTCTISLSSPSHSYVRISLLSQTPIRCLKGSYCRGSALPHWKRRMMVGCPVLQTLKCCLPTWAREYGRKVPVVDRMH